MAAIAFDAATNLGGTTSTSLTGTHTCTGTNLLLFVQVIGDTATEDISSVTYNSIPMAQVTTPILVPSDRYLYLYYLPNPASGANTVAINFSSSHVIQATSASYTSTQQVASLDVSGTATVTSGTSISKTLTTLTDNDWSIAVVESSGGSVSAGASTTLRVNGVNNGAGIFDSNAAITPPGNTTLNVNNTSSVNMGMIMAAFKVFNPLSNGSKLTTNTKYW